MSVVLHPSEWADSRVCLAVPAMVDVSSISHEAAVWFWHEYAFSFLSKYLGIRLWVWRGSLLAGSLRFTSFLKQLMPACLGMVPPTVGRAFPHELVIKTCPQTCRQTNLI